MATGLPKDPLRFLFITDHPEEGASSRFRIYQFLPYFERQNIECRVEPFTSEALYKLIHQSGHTLPKLVRTGLRTLRRLRVLATSRRYDLVFLHREAFPFGPPLLELWFASLARRLVFDFDDAIYAGHAEPESLRQPFLYRLKYGRQVHRVVKAADRVIAGNRILGDFARRFSSHVEVVPTVIDTNRYAFREPQSAVSAVVVGWMGSPSTSPYLRSLEGVFRELKARHGERITFAFYGDSAYTPKLEHADVRPFCLATEVADLRRIDIGLMPQPDNEWTRGKCAFKAIQYMALGIPAVCSPVGIVPDLITDGENGFLCRSEKEWIDKLSSLVDSLELRRRIASQARKMIEGEYSVATWAPRLTEILREAATGRPLERPESMEARIHSRGV